MEYLQYIVVNNGTYRLSDMVLNLIINGIPSILDWKKLIISMIALVSFKPYYKWNTFNTVSNHKFTEDQMRVLNLIINGIPSIHSLIHYKNMTTLGSFKPYYKWNTFNTQWKRSRRCRS